VSVVNREAADYGVAELSAAGEFMGHTILENGDLMLGADPAGSRCSECRRRITARS
jgi:hypothetical protein